MNIYVHTHTYMYMHTQANTRTIALAIKYINNVVFGEQILDLGYRRKITTNLGTFEF